MSAFDVAGQLGYVVVPLATSAEGMGLPVPGETTLIAAALLAAKGHMAIVVVIACAAAGAIVGDNAGYLLGRRFGRAALLAPGPGRRMRRHAVEASSALFARHGPPAVFLGRFVGVGRIAIAWMAGAGEMPWRRFLVWNGAACVTWAALVGCVTYFVGSAGARWIALAGIVLAAASVLRAAWSSRQEPGD